MSTSSEAAGPARTDRDAPAAFHLLAKPTGAQCNLDCDYCFFLSKEMLYPDSRFRMSDEQLDAYLRQLIEAHAQVPEVTIAWQGGEPTLMGLDFFRRSVEIAARYLSPGQRAVHTIQTNGTLIDAEWAEFFKAHDYLVGISIDGPREIHDAYRVTKGGRGSFDKVMRGLAHLRDAGVEFNALTTLHAANAHRGVEVYRFLRDDCGARFIQFIPIIERVEEAELDGTVPWSSWRDRPLYVQRGDAVTGRSIGGEQYGRFLIDVFEEWVRRDVGEVYVQMFDVALANWFGEPPGLCVHSETCGLALALEHNGRPVLVRPLRRAGPPARQHRRDADARPRGLAAPARLRTGQARHAAPPVPRLRRALRLPRRLSRRTASSTPPDGEPGLNYLCEGYLAFFHHVDEPMRTMCDAARRTDARPRRSCRGTPVRTPSAGATTRAPAAAAASGSSATATRAPALAEGARRRRQSPPGGPGRPSS